MKPILFNQEMTRAILDGRKTVTRLLVKPRYRDGEVGFQVVTNKHTGQYVRIEVVDEWEHETRWMNEPYRPGDILYVRETWGEDNHNWLYKADFSDADLKKLRHLLRWRPSIHMPRKAARIFLRVKNVRVERLQDITEKQAESEGFFCGWCMTEHSSRAMSAKQAFMWMWNRPIKKSGLSLYSWIANPWVWVIEFERISKEEALKSES